MSDSSLKRALSDALKHGGAKQAALGAGVVVGAGVLAKVGWDRLTSSEDPRRFRLGGGEPLPDGLRRIANGQLDMSIEHLEGRSGETTSKAVHETRKSFKRLRSLVRLARDELGDEVYRRENEAFRDAGRRLGGARDNQVLLETLDLVNERGPNEPPPARFQRFRKTLVGQHAAAQRRLKEGKAADETLRDLREARARIADWPLENGGLDSLAPGFKRIYRRGRRAYRVAREEPSTENLHELRKRVKDLWYAAQIARPAEPERMKETARLAHDLSDLIGQDHDLALLGERAVECQDRFDDKASLSELTEVIEQRRDELQRSALKLAKRVYRKRPRKVVRPLKRAGATA